MAIYTGLDPDWKKSSFSESGNCLEARFKASTFSNGTNCVEGAIIAGEVQVRDSKDPGPVLTFSPGAWEEFLRTVR